MMMVILWILFLDFPLPLDYLQILNVLTNLGSCDQKNGETIKGYCARLENIFIQIQKMGYKDVSELHKAYTQRGVLRYAYNEHECLKYIQDKSKNDDLTLKNFDSSLEFSKQMTKQFTNNNINKDEKMTSLRTINSISLLVVLLILPLMTRISARIQPNRLKKIMMKL